MEMKKFASDITVLICKDFGSAHSFQLCFSGTRFCSLPAPVLSLMGDMSHVLLEEKKEIWPPTCLKQEQDKTLRYSLTTLTRRMDFNLHLLWKQIFLNKLLTVWMCLHQ